MNNINVNDQLSFMDDSHTKHGLRGHVQIFRENLETKEKTLWYEDDNIIPISGYQWILMKMFGLYLDSSHKKNYENLGQDTTVVVPDLNGSGTYQFGVDPVDYEAMNSDISENHFVQGFMIGNGGSGEDSITTKNTDYSFTRLRNPIPFQQTQQNSLNADVAGKYLGKLRVGESSFSSSYFIKKFDERPHIYHSWWKDGQSWDHVDPVTQNDLGPNAVNGVGKTNRIETYCEVKMSLSADDCVAYFSHDGATQTAVVNELGLVAFDTVPGNRSIVETVYSTMVKELLTIIFDNNRGVEIDDVVITKASEIVAVLDPLLRSKGNKNINSFLDTINTIANSTAGAIDYDLYKNDLTSDTNIGVHAYYDHTGAIAYTTDEFLTYLSSDEFSGLTTDEAQRIKLITYYTFNSIPLQSNWKIHINYRIYAN